jgi:mycofactocin precursor peptide peptidase
MTDLASLTWPDVAELAPERCTLLLPVGSTEQHGPHLPLSTDTDVGRSVAEGAAARRNRLVVAPPLAYGSSGEHQGFAGTLSIGQEATEMVIIELVRSAVGFGSIVIVSAHGGNAEPLERAVKRLDDEGHPVLVWSPRWSGDLHAGRTETSLMLAIAPDRVQMERAQAGDTRPGRVILPELRRRGVQSVSANGVLGDPQGANAAEGRALLEKAVDDLLAAIDGWHETEGREVPR